MDEHHAAHAASLRFVLRLFVLAGAAVAGWLMLSGGPAQADAVHSHSHGAGAAATVSQTVHSARASQGTLGTLHRTVAVVTGPLRHGPGRLAEMVDRSTARAPRPADTALESLVTTLEPALTATTTDVAGVVDRTAATVDSVVAPVLEATGVQEHASDVAPSTSLPATVAPRARHDQPRIDGPAAASARAFAATALPAAHVVRQVLQAVDDTRLPAIPAGGELPIPASTGTVLLAGVLAGLVLLLPALVRRRPGFGSDLLPLGPAYPPGSSPG